MLSPKSVAVPMTRTVVEVNETRLSAAEFEISYPIARQPAAMPPVS
ncbi:hypothetical protein ACGF12_26810 [Kitasatospora sp. NPDC048296]